MTNSRTLLSRIESRPIFFLMFVACAGLLAFGYYLQFVQHLEPCPLCIFQRMAFFAVGLVALIAGLHHPGARGTGRYAVALAAFAAIGAVLAARQTWLQHLPADKVPECGPGLEYMLEVFPVWDVLRTVLRGTGDCAKVDWTLFGLSIAEWALMTFIALAGLSVTAWRRRAS